MRSIEALEQEVAAIGDLSREELLARWQKAYGCPPPKGINRPLLERSAAWHLQARKLGGLSSSTRAALRVGAGKPNGGMKSGCRTEIAGGTDSLASECAVAAVGSAPVSAPDRKPRGPAPVVGTRLMREWNGRMHVVDVSDQGILFDGRIYGSLSAVAKRITGAHWSGPRFFGL
jgi:hypothetical protein